MWHGWSANRGSPELAASRGVRPKQVGVVLVADQEAHVAHDHGVWGKTELPAEPGRLDAIEAPKIGAAPDHVGCASQARPRGLRWFSSQSLAYFWNAWDAPSSAMMRPGTPSRKPSLRQ